MARSAPTRPPSAWRVRHSAYRDQEGPLSGTSARATAVVPRHPAGPRGGRRPRHGAVRPPRSPRAASHRRGSTLTTTFRDLGILPETAEALEAVGIITPFPIQEMTLPVALSGTDVIGQAKTGTGKTLGFGLPLLERVTVPADVEAGRAKPEQLDRRPAGARRRPHPRAVPAGHQRPADRRQGPQRPRARRSTAAARTSRRSRRSRRASTSIVGTPGRLLDLAGQKKLDLSHVRALVLDEADEMLDLGFLPDVEKIINMLPAKRQTMLFSATMPGAVIGLARRYMSQPTHIRATAPDDEGATVANTTQHVFRAHSMDKPEMVSRILQADGRGLAMIFCRTKRTAADIAEQLDAARLRLRRGPRRPRPGRPRAGAARLPQRQGRRPRLHRRRRARHRRRGRDARHQLPDARGREDLPAPHRPHRPRGRLGHRRSRWSTGTTSRAGS